MHQSDGEIDIVLIAGFRYCSRISIFRSTGAGRVDFSSAEAQEQHVLYWTFGILHCGLHSLHFLSTRQTRHTRAHYHTTSFHTCHRYLGASDAQSFRYTTTVRSLLHLCEGIHILMHQSHGEVNMMVALG